MLFLHGLQAHMLFIQWFTTERITDPVLYTAVLLEI